MTDLRMAPFTGHAPTVQAVRTEILLPDNPKTPKGGRTWNFPHPSLSINGNTMIAKRFPEDTVGDHFHNRAPGKDPEKFLLIMGDVEFWFLDIFGNERSVSLSAAKGMPQIFIPPYVLHGVKVLSQEAWFLEQQEEPFAPGKNTYTREEFELFIKQHRNH